MSRTTTMLIVLGVLLLVVVGFPLIWYFGTYNSLLGSRVNTEAKWSEVQNQYQRRYDLIPSLVNSTKIYINYETNLLKSITEARSQWGASLSQSVEKQMEAQGTLDSVMSRLLMVVSVENYPELKGDQVVMTLMDELAGTNNRIAVARMRYIESVQGYNTAIQMFPNNIVAGMSGFLPKPNYSADVLAQTAPKVPVS